ncbi:MAG: efflux RND transporter periplasmic adaptor subunit [Janthinobacterium lividum]
MPEPLQSSNSYREELALNQPEKNQPPQNYLEERNYDETHPGNLQAPVMQATVAGGPEQQERPNSAAAVPADTGSGLGRGPVLLVAVVAILLLIAIVFGLLRRASSERALRASTNAAAVPNVQVTHATGGAAAQEIRLPADTQSFLDTAIYSRTNGYLLKWYADIGTNVRKGQLLAVVQTPEVDQQVQQAEANVGTAEANQKLAETTNERWKGLLAKNAVSRQEADQTASDLLVKQSALLAAGANLRRLQQLQSFERIYAPFAGVISARNVDVGSLVQAGDSNAPHSELFHLNSVGTLRMFVPVPEVYVRAVHDGEHVKVTSDAFPGETFEGTIARNATAIDSASRTLRVEVDVPNLSHRLLPGQYTFVHLPVPAAVASLTLPSNTILFRSEGLRVGLVQNGHVHLQSISIGHDYGATVEVTAGLHPSDAVILNPSDSLAEGAPVNVEGR